MIPASTPVVHDRYGIPGFGRHAQVVQTPGGPICEVPIATVRLSTRQTVPVGGGYLRLLPYCYTAAGLRRINNEEHDASCIYFHPWEGKVTPEEGETLCRIPSMHANALSTLDLQRRVEKLEEGAPHDDGKVAIVKDYR